MFKHEVRQPGYCDINQETEKFFERLISTGFITHMGLVGYYTEHGYPYVNLYLITAEKGILRIENKVGKCERY